MSDALRSASAGRVLPTLKTPSFRPVERTASRGTRTRSRGRVVVVTTSAVITLVRLAIGRMRRGSRRQSTSPVSTSNTIPALGGLSLKRARKASSPSSATAAGADGGAGGSSAAGGEASDSPSPPMSHPPSASAASAAAGAISALVIRGRRQRPQDAEPEHGEDDQGNDHQNVDTVLDGHAEGQERQRADHQQRGHECGVARGQ